MINLSIEIVQELAGAEIYTVDNESPIRLWSNEDFLTEEFDHSIWLTDGNSNGIVRICESVLLDYSFALQIELSHFMLNGELNTNYRFVSFCCNQKFEEQTLRDAIEMLNKCSQFDLLYYLASHVREQFSKDYFHPKCPETMKYLEAEIEGESLILQTSKLAKLSQG